jgi:flagellar protein FlaG
MPIDNIVHMNRIQAGAVPSVPAVPAGSGARQELPPIGAALPPAATSSEVSQAVSRLNDYVQNLRRDLQFRMDEDSNRVIVTVVDSESGEVIRQIPSDEVLAVARSLEHARGLLVNEKA